MKATLGQQVVTLFTLLNLWSILVGAQEDHDHGEEHAHDWEVVAAFQIDEPSLITWVVEKGEHEEEHEDEHDGHNHRRLKLEDDHDHDGEHEEGYEFDHNRIVVQLLPTDCTSDSIESLEEGVEVIWDDNATVFNETDSGEDPLVVSVADGYLTRELHVNELSFISLYYLNVSESGCLVIFSEHEALVDSLRNDEGVAFEAAFLEPEMLEEEISINYSADIWLKSLAATLITSVVSLSGAFLLLLGMKDEASFISRSTNEILALAMGVLLAVVFIHLLPEAAEFYGELDFSFGVTILASSFVAFLMKLFLEHDHVGETELDILEKDAKVSSLEDEHKSVKSRILQSSISMNILLGDAFHNFSDGVLIATAFGACSTDDSLGWIVTASVILHEIPQELADFVVLYTDLGSYTIALGFNLLCSFTAAIGVISILSLGRLSSRAQGLLFAVNIGVLLFISFGELAPRITNCENNKKKLLRAAMVVFGFAIVGLLQLSPHAHCEEDGHNH